MKQMPKIPPFDARLGPIHAAPSAADLARLVGTVRTSFTGTQREDLDAASAMRPGEPPTGEARGR